MGKKDRGGRHGRGKKGDGHERPSPAATDVDRATLATRLNAATVHLLRRLAREEDSSSVTGPRLSALSVLVFGGPHSLRGLADAEGITPPSMTRLVAALEHEGLIERDRNPVDARKIVIRATPAGESLMREGRDRRVEALAGWLETASRAELATLDASVAVLERIVGSGRPRMARS